MGSCYRLPNLRAEQDKLVLELPYLILKTKVKTLTCVLVDGSFGILLTMVEFQAGPKDHYDVHFRTGPPTLPRLLPPCSCTKCCVG